ncbi:hypothetical protein ISF_06709 [Cordyceps fumosorosea ARSEF 2679]|uniref:Uncharacterized protein n=1 Tax=Cordyceps fumosorosea (strain ARSEF 2679) TaxID=1081104 RepID=A0A167R110_CORFA|nr:hypothetical protein ISF_06709 [Cordyceps fumosorosea ARSEF 2679]OAA58170.1 hypothetical protein ISF_06709 [Cordyceps fumosorosea ARSEF 2679]
MSITSRTAWRVAYGSAILASSLYLGQTARRIAASSKLGITDENVALPSFIESQTIRDYVNPQNRQSRAVDIHTATLDVPLNKDDVSDEALLAQATKSFFNGCVFYPEAKALNLLKLKDSKYSKLASTTVPAHVWDAAELSETSLPALHTVLFGVFRLADVCLSKDPSSGTPSHADFLFGSDMTTFAGCHRLSVQRLEVDAASETQRVRLQMQCYACNPQSDKSAGGLLLGFHRLYASMLFRETAGQLHRWLHPSTSSWWT